MLKKFKHIFSFLLVALSALPLLFSAFFLIRQTIIRHQMMERIELVSVQRIEIPKDNIHWYKKGKELLIGGKLFDVRKLTETNNSLIVEGLFDDAETSLQLTLNRIMDNDEDGLQKASLIYQLLVQSAQQIHSTNDFLFSPPGAIHEKHINLSSSRLLMAVMPLLSPPPENLRIRFL